MNKVFFLIIFTLLISCSEGDIIENDISNFTAPLENCSNQSNDTFVFFKTDSEINQSISLSFTSTVFELNTIPDNEELTLTITLDGTANVLIYRQFDTAINGSEYFCSSVPPGDITVTQELISSNGNAEIKYTLLSETMTEATYTRSFTLNDITLEGPDIAIRQEVLEFGNDEITITK
ncbi:hypothetical protein [Aquimarina algiphila]|uniref:hypothetical protein n=1 Tax=Aquimarina algiphila TaxID=2047982 RepID=UPI0024919E8E|nr:hypothetical protein [Aquimarina algiphila]